MANVLDVALEFAAKNDVEKIRAINLEVGALSDIVPQIAQDFFGFIAKGTIAEGAQVNMERIPAVIKCRTCGLEDDFNMDHPSLVCPDCGSKSVELISGREWRIGSIEVQ